MTTGGGTDISGTTPVCWLKTACCVGCIGGGGTDWIEFCAEVGPDGGGPDANCVPIGGMEVMGYEIGGGIEVGAPMEGAGKEPRAF